MNKQKNPHVLSEAFVLELHKRLFGSAWKWAGTLRRTEKSIGVDPIQVAIQLRQLLDDAKYWVEHGTYSPKGLVVTGWKL